MLPGQEPSFPPPADDLPDGLMPHPAPERRDAASDMPPPVGTTPPAQLAALAVQGKRGAAWRLLHWIDEDSQEAIEAVRQFPDRRLLELLLEWLARGTWAGKPLKVPRAMRQPHLRIQVSTLFLPGLGAPEAAVKGVLIAALHHSQLQMRATAAYLLGMLGDPLLAADLAGALHDQASAVRVQAAKALRRLHIPGMAAALVEALRYHDEALASQIHQALLELGSAAVPPLIQAASSPDAWVRWHTLRILGELHDTRGLRPLVEALADEDRAVAWMAAHALALMDAPVVEEVLRLLLRAPDTPQLMETAAHVLRAQSNKQLKGILRPVIESMRDVDYRVAMPLAVERALEQLAKRG
jgi:HEAT repeat protein